MYATVQILGSLLILAAFVATLAGRLDQSGYPYLTLNVVGSAVLAVEAAIGAEWGFLLLEGVWALVSAASIARRFAGGRARRPTPATNL